MKSFPLFAFSFFLSMQVLAADSSDLLMSSVDSLNPKSNLAIVEQQMDIDAILHALENGYGGKNFLPKNEYASLVASLNNLRSESVAGISSQVFCVKIQRMMDLVSDNHLGITSNGWTCGKKYPEAHVGNNILGDGEIPWAILKRNINNREIPILAISKFPSSSYSVWNGFLESVKSLLAYSDIIIDLRGNPGGDDSKGKQMANIFYGLPELGQGPSPVEKLITRNTPAATVSFVNYRLIQMYYLKQQGKPVPPELFRLYQESLKFYQLSLSGGTVPEEAFVVPSVVLDASKIYSGNIYVLIDRHCGSACETTLQALEAFPKLITVGENTTGVVTYLNAGLIFLKNSSLVMAMPSRASVFKDGRVVEKIGYAPQIPIAAGRDALDELLSILGRHRLRP